MRNTADGEPESGTDPRFSDGSQEVRFQGEGHDGIYLGGSHPSPTGLPEPDRADKGVLRSYLSKMTGPLSRHRQRDRSDGTPRGATWSYSVSTAQVSTTLHVGRCRAPGQGRPGAWQAERAGHGAILQREYEGFGQQRWIEFVRRRVRRWYPPASGVNKPDGKPSYVWDMVHQGDQDGVRDIYQQYRR
jgi:hypothetical protein